MRMYRKQADPGTLHDHNKGGFKRRLGSKRSSPPKSIGGMGNYLGNNLKKIGPAKDKTNDLYATN